MQTFEGSRLGRNGDKAVKIQEFTKAKKLMREIAKTHGIKNEKDFVIFTNSPAWSQYSSLLPKKPWIYYSKENVTKRRKAGIMD